VLASNRPVSYSKGVRVLSKKDSLIDGCLSFVLFTKICRKGAFQFMKEGNNQGQKKIGGSGLGVFNREKTDFARHKKGAQRPALTHREDEGKKTWGQAAFRGPLSNASGLRSPRLKKKEKRDGCKGLRTG